MRLAVVLMLLLAPLAGCLGGDEEAPADLTEQSTGPAEEGAAPVPYAASNNTTMDPEMENATIGDEHLHDEWGSASELTLFEGTIEAGDCRGFGQVFRDVFVGVFTQEVSRGCAFMTLPKTVLVPEGTAAVRLEVDATSALQNGGFRSEVETASDKELEGEPTTEPVTTWRWDIEPTDWDLPHQGESDYTFYFEADGQLAQLEGPMQVSVIVERQDDWEPIKAMAHLDHWDLEERHDFVGPGNVRILDSTQPIDFPAFTGFATNADFPDPIPFEGIVLPGSRQLTVVTIYENGVQGCPAGHECIPFAVITTGQEGGRGGSFVEWQERTDTYTLQVFKVPDETGEDSTYAEQSAYAIDPTLIICAEQGAQAQLGPFPAGCLARTAVSTSAELRYEVEVWRGAADLNALKARLGLE